jgi:hypothetical protein
LIERTAPELERAEGWEVWLCCARTVLCYAVLCGVVLGHGITWAAEMFASPLNRNAMSQDRRPEKPILILCASYASIAANRR